MTGNVKFKAILLVYLYIREKQHSMNMEEYEQLLESDDW